MVQAPRGQADRPHALVLGLGVTGVSCVRHLLARGHRVTAMDSRREPPGRIEVEALQRAAQDALATSFGVFDPQLLQGVDQLVVSPGIALTETIVQTAMARGIEVIGDIELFARAAGERELVAITGTNGKSTTTMLVDEMLRASGRCSVAAGNIGLPALEVLEAPDGQTVVLELSSFQLERTRSLAPRVAALLNISEDHLDQHPSFAEYAAAKARVFHGADVAVINADSAQLGGVLPPPGLARLTFSVDTPTADFGVIECAGRRWLGRCGTPLLQLDDMRLVGRHNLANALAALACVEGLLGEIPAGALEALAGYAGLPHRMQFVRERGGVRWIDDSKATNPGATLAAVGGLEAPLVLIAGGLGKGADFSPLASALSERARAVVVIGQDAPRLKAALASALTAHEATDMEDAVRQAEALALPGDIVLLSPACASQDMFRNYEHRGEVFGRCVEALE